MNKKNIKKNFQVLIPLRKGSKRIKNKNFVKINNKPLIHFTIKEVKKIFNNENIFLSSNDIKAKKYALKNKLQFIERPDKLCKDNSSTEEAIIHFLNFQEKHKLNITKNLILLQATSPLRKSYHILGSIKKFLSMNLDSLFSAYTEKCFLWKENTPRTKLISISYNYKKRERSQKLSKLIFENGAIFIFKVSGFKKFKNRIFGNFNYYLMNKRYSVDIDNLNDLQRFRRNEKNE